MADPAIPAALKRVVSERARGCCEYCLSQERFALQSFSVEHIIPRSKRGTDDNENLAFACQGCNNHKYNRTHALDPLNGDVVPLYNPRLQAWSEHFAWNENFTELVGLTPTARATIEALQLNRAPLINLRRILYEAAEHPPPRAQTAS